MYIVRKMNKRTYVCDDTDTDAPVFTAPGWLRSRVPNRAAYQDLANEINSGKHYADAAIDFYRKWNKIG